MKNKIHFLLFTVILSFNAFAQTANPWSTANSRELSVLTNTKDVSFPASSLFFRLDLENMTKSLMEIVDTPEKKIIITIPNTNGELESFKVWESSNFAPELQASFPKIRSFAGNGITDPTSNLNISLSHKGIQTMVMRADKTVEFIEPYTKDGLYYAVFNKRNKTDNGIPFSCLTAEEQSLAEPISSSVSARAISNQKQLKKFRLALSCTGEYTAYHGGTTEDALAAMNATMTRVNGVYNTDIAVKLELIANNTSLIYLNASTDPYSDASTGVNGAWNIELQNNLTKTLGNYPSNPNYLSDANALYDIGHLFGASGGGGNAGCIGCVCDDPTGIISTNTQPVPQKKGMGYTSPADAHPEGDNFDIDYVSHEMGHQLGAEHTFSFSHTSTDSGIAYVEPGSGSTIMGYAGITPYDIQKHTDPYFSYISIQQIQTNLGNKTCQTNIPLSNNPPTIDAGGSYTIPAATPFRLIGTASDPDGDALTFDWEQIDSNNSQSSINSNSYAYPTKTVGPNFRSYIPSTSPVRYFPNLNTILTSTTTTPQNSNYEALTAKGTNRSLNFALTGRDNRADGGQTNSGTMKVTVDGTKGPFYITSSTTDNINWTPGNSETITWAVNSSNTISGGDNVDILLSTDNGLTYNHVLASNIPNNGSASITVPNLTATNCRFMIKASGNIFLAINQKTFSIGVPVTTNCVSPKNTTATNIPDKGTNFTTSTINNSTAGYVTNVKVSINVTHSNFSQLSFVLVSPSGTEIKLASNLCIGINANPAIINFTDNGQVISCSTSGLGSSANVFPQDHLFKLIGENAQGDWTLKFIDNTTGNIGTLNSWSLNLCYQDQEFSYALSNDKFEFNKLSLYPNPTNDIVNISVPDESNLPENLIIYNSIGQMVYNTKINSTKDLTFSTSRLASGVYFVKVNKADATATLKFIKN